jgi:hypothetical protein
MSLSTPAEVQSLIAVHFWDNGTPIPISLLLISMFFIHSMGYSLGVRSVVVFTATCHWGIVFPRVTVFFGLVWLSWFYETSLINGMYQSCVIPQGEDSGYDLSRFETETAVISHQCVKLQNPFTCSY